MVFPGVRLLQLQRHEYKQLWDGEAIIWSLNMQLFGHKPWKTREQILKSFVHLCPQLIGPDLNKTKRKSSRLCLIHQSFIVCIVFFWIFHSSSNVRNMNHKKQHMFFMTKGYYIAWNRSLFRLYYHLYQKSRSYV